MQVQVQSSVQLLLLCCSILEQRRLHRIALATLLSNSFTHSSRGKSSRERAHIKTLLKPWKDRTKSVLAGGCIIPAAATSSTNLYFPIEENLSIICSAGCSKGESLNANTWYGPFLPLPLYADIGTKMSHYLKLSLNSLCGDWAPRGGGRRGRGGFYLC